MQDILPFYERELAYLRRYGQEFAERYPKIAGRLQISADGSQDPHVERLIEAFALLTARISKRLDDDYPQFTDALLEVLYPQFLRPFPSCSIACFDRNRGASRQRDPVRIPPGTPLKSRMVRGVACEFRTVYEVTLAPVMITAVSYRAVAAAPAVVRLPAHSGGQISIAVQLAAGERSFDGIGVSTLRLFLDGEPSLRAALRDALGLNVIAAYVESDDCGRWKALAKVPLREVGFEEEDALVPASARSHPAYQLLTELFSFPEKFGFVDLVLPPLVEDAMQRFTLHLVLGAAPADRGSPLVLEALDAANIRLGCTPVVNLFPSAGEPIRVNHRSISYPVLADARRAFAYEVYSIDSVQRVRQTPHGDDVQVFRSLYSLHHGDDPDHSGQYWTSCRDEDAAEKNPGYEVQMSFVDLAFNPVMPQTETISIELTCSNRDLPHHLAFGAKGGDLSMEGGGPAVAISLLRKPTRSLRFRNGQGAHWRLISHLSINQLSLTASGLSAIKEMLRLYDLSSSLVTAAQIDGIVALDHKPCNAWMAGREFASMVRGLDIWMTIDPARFVGTSIAIFARVMDHFFSLYVNANSFTRFRLISSETGQEIVRCLQRNGDAIVG